MERAGVGPGFLVQRQGDTPYAGRLGRRRVRRCDAGAGAVASGVRPGQAVQDRFAAAALGRRRCGGKTALVGLQMAVDRINKSGGVNGRPIETVVADDECKPDVGRRKTEKLLVEDKIDAHVGGFLSNICLACMPVFEENKVVNMISVCLDTTLTTTKCNRYSFRTFDYAPAQAVAIAPYLVNKMGKKWHIAFADYSWGQSTRDAYATEIKKLGGEVVGTTGIPLGTADMTSFLSKIQGDFDGLFGIFFGKDGVTIGNQAFDLGLTKKYKWAGDGAIAESVNLPALGNKIEGFVGINRYIPVFEGPLNTPSHKKFFDDAKARLLRDRFKRSAARPLRAVELRSDERPQARYGEVEVRGPPGHHEADRGARRSGDEGRRRLPAGRRCDPQGGSPGVHPGVHLRDQGRQT